MTEIYLIPRLTLNTKLTYLYVMTDQKLKSSLEIPATYNHEVGTVSHVEENWNTND